MTHHLKAWVTICDQRSITIHTDVALRAAETIRSTGMVLTDPDMSKPYTPEAFVDALVEFVVGDDQAKLF
jgi:hypothetical protein